MKEIWKPVVGCSAYLASNKGRVKRIRDRDGNPDNTILRPTKSQGYLRVRVFGDKGKRWVEGVHELVARAFLGLDRSRPRGRRKPWHHYLFIANHKNHIKHDNRLCNLELMSLFHNSQEAQWWRHSRRDKDYKKKWPTFKAWLKGRPQ